MAAKKEFRDLATAFFFATLDRHQFREAEAIGGLVKDPVVDYWRFLIALETRKSLAANDVGWIQGLAANRSLYIKSLLSLLRPAFAIDLFNKVKPASKAEKSYFLMALRFSGDTLQPQMSTQQKRQLASLLPSEAKKPASSAEKAYAKVKLPAAKGSPAVYERALTAAVTAVRNARSLLKKDLGKMDLVQKRSLFETAVRVEKQTGEAISKSPLPSGLGTEESKQYRDGLKELAGEFEKQSAEMEKLVAALDSSLKEQERSEAESRLQSVAFESWPWPEGEETARLKALAEASQSVLFMVMLDRTLEKKKIGNKDYYWMRAGLFATRGETALVRDYIGEELEKFGHADIVEKWRSLKQ